jgi:hypothetical protein
MKRVLIMALLGTLGCARAALAQGVTGDTSSRSSGGPVFLTDVGYSALTRLTGSAGLLIPLGDQSRYSHGDIVQARRGLELTASAGTGGVQFGAGYSAIEREDQAPLFFGADVRAIIGRLASSGSSPSSTYVGVDAGYTFLHIRGSLGVAYRVNGTSSHTRWMFAPSIGIAIPLGHRW